MGQWLSLKLKGHPSPASSWAEPFFRRSEGSPTPQHRATWDSSARRQKLGRSGWRRVWSRKFKL